MNLGYVMKTQIKKKEKATSCNATKELEILGPLGETVCPRNERINEKL